MKVSYGCMECGHKFKTLKEAEKAAFGAKGCPKCGSSDIDVTSGPFVGAVTTHKININ